MSWCRDLLEPVVRIFGTSTDNSCCTPEEKKYSRKKDTTKNGITCLSIGDCAMAKGPKATMVREKHKREKKEKAVPACQGLTATQHAASFVKRSRGRVMHASYFNPV